MSRSGLGFEVLGMGTKVSFDASSQGMLKDGCKDDVALLADDDCTWCKANQVLGTLLDKHVLKSTICSSSFRG